MIVLLIVRWMKINYSDSMAMIDNENWQPHHILYQNDPGTTGSI